MKDKIGSLVTFLIFIFSTLIFAQYPQLDFPLQIGNLWQYSEGPGYYSESKAIKDTLMQNGFTYTIVKGELLSGFFRKDSSKVFLYNSSTNDESLYCDFSKKVGDTLSLYTNEMDTIITTVYEDGTYLIFGQQKHYMAFLTKSANSSGYGIKYITDGLGFTRYNGEVFYYGLSGAIINGMQYGVILNVKDEEKNIPNIFELLQNYPNPFNPNTTIEFHLNEPARVRIEIYNVLGKCIKTLFEQYTNVGKYKINFNGRNLSSGIYFYTINVNGTSETKSMVLLK
jgi:Secretion system C-terminal sorting domain